MAVSFNRTDLKVIARIDDSLDPACLEKYDSYLKDLDESKLSFLEGCEPTRFVIKKSLGWQESSDLKNKQVKMNRGVGSQAGDMKIDINVGSTPMEEVRLALVDIEHPDGSDPGCLVFVKDIDGYASKTLIADLDSCGIVENLYTAKQNASPKAATKKS
jgi:hypothetical protein